MLFRQLFDATSSTYTYLLADSTTRSALLIDPVLDQIALYERLLQELSLKLVFTIDTHTHADHITASGMLRQKFQSQVVMGENTKATRVDIKIKDGDSLRRDGLTLQAIYTPGHTSDSFSFYNDHRVFTGDALLIRSTGRTDFQEGDAYQAYDSLFNKLLKLPDETLVYPGHDYKGMTVSTIAEEKRCNPRLQVSSATEYARIMGQLNLAHPKQIDVAVPANLNCGII